VFLTGIVMFTPSSLLRVAVVELQRVANV